VVLRFDGSPRTEASDGAATHHELALGVPLEASVPALGIGLRPEDLPGAEPRAGELAALGLRHVVAHLDLSRGHGAEALAGHARFAAAAGAELVLEAALACTQPPADELGALAALCQEAGAKPAALIVSPALDMKSVSPGDEGPPLPPLATIYEAARAAFPGVTLGGGTLAYFTEPEDLIPDHIPGLGFLDDAIMVELVVRELRHEIEAYQDFCEFRVREEMRRGRKNEDPVTREEWLRSRRRELHSRMRRRRRSERKRGGSRRSPLSLF